MLQHATAAANVRLHGACCNAEHYHSRLQRDAGLTGGSGRCHAPNLARSVQNVCPPSLTECCSTMCRAICPFMNVSLLTCAGHMASIASNSASTSTPALAPGAAALLKPAGIAGTAGGGGDGGGNDEGGGGGGCCSALAPPLAAFWPETPRPPPDRPPRCCSPLPGWAGTRGAGKEADRSPRCWPGSEAATRECEGCCTIRACSTAPRRDGAFSAATAPDPCRSAKKFSACCAASAQLPCSCFCVPFARNICTAA